MTHILCTRESLLRISKAFDGSPKVRILSATEALHDRLARHDSHSPKGAVVVRQSLVVLPGSLLNINRSYIARTGLTKCTSAIF